MDPSLRPTDLDLARAAWLAGDAAAWTRYAACLARLRADARPGRAAAVHLDPARPTYTFLRPVPRP